MPAHKDLNCSNCEHWSSKDPSLDGGRELIGTCNHVADLEAIWTACYRESSWREDQAIQSFRARTRSSPAMLQVASAASLWAPPQVGPSVGPLHGGAGQDGVPPKPYLRTAPWFSCSSHALRAPRKPEQQSLTENRVRS